MSDGGDTPLDQWGDARSPLTMDPGRQEPFLQPFRVSVLGSFGRSEHPRFLHLQSRGPNPN
eukprot:1061697-Prorocentrum_minimum.AAC.1